MTDTLTALSPLDGRYHAKVDDLRPIFSEYGLIRYRLIVEIKWFEALAENPDIKQVPALSDGAKTYLSDCIAQFSTEEAKRVKTIEATTNHDVKAVEYYLKEQFTQHDELAPLVEFIHFACTSEDINNLAYALMLRDAVPYLQTKVFTPLLSELKNLAHMSAEFAMLSRTHGQAASPTTMGKEIANVAYRLERQLEQLKNFPILAKINGAVGNFNAHTVAFPDVNWVAHSQHFIENLGLTDNPYTTQIEPHDNICELFTLFSRMNTILLDLNRDCWGYISLGYYTQRLKAGEVGSSTMPHKVNPIDFENSEGNIGIANAMFAHFNAKLPVSRWQRDLSDSTVLRNIGVAIGHMVIAWSATQKGLSKLQAQPERMLFDLNQNWQILGEAIQTVLRREGVPDAYELLKDLTRGKTVTEDSLEAFIQQLPLSDEDKQLLIKLRPEHYLGLAKTKANAI